MNTMLDKMQEKLSPIAMKVGNQKFLVALRDSFVGTMPVIMTGSISTKIRLQQPIWLRSSLKNSWLI